MAVREEQVELILRSWQKTLKLEHWLIQFQPETGNKPDPWEEDQRAVMWRSRDYHLGEFFINPEVLEKDTILEVQRLVVHELLHLVTLDLESILGQIEDHVSKSMHELISDQFEHNLERAVDFIAYRLVEINAHAR